MIARASGRHWPALGVLLLTLSPPLVAQGVTLTTAGNTIGVRAPRLAIVEGSVLERLRNGRSVEVELDLSILSGRNGRILASARQTFRLSYDLWEERFAASRVGQPPSSVSHLAARDLEAWCLNQVTVARSTLEAALGRRTPFWVRLSHTPLADPADTSGADRGPFTLRTLVDALSRKAAAPGRTISLEAGPFSLPD